MAKSGESEERSSIFGDTTTHRDASGKKVGESEQRSSIFGDTTIHRDASGKKVGESEQRSSIFGDKTVHEGDWPFFGGESATSSLVDALAETFSSSDRKSARRARKAMHSHTAEEQGSLLGRLVKTAVTFWALYVLAKALRTALIVLGVVLAAVLVVVGLVVLFT